MHPVNKAFSGLLFGAYPSTALQVLRELERLTAAVLAGGEAATLVEAMKDRERRRAILQRDLIELERPATSPTDATRVRKLLRERMAEWRGLLRKHAPVARQMLRSSLKPESRSHRTLRRGLIGSRRPLRVFQRVSLSTRYGVPKPSELEPDCRVLESHAATAGCRRYRGMSLQHPRAHGALPCSQPGLELSICSLFSVRQK